MHGETVQKSDSPPPLEDGVPRRPPVPGAQVDPIDAIVLALRAGAFDCLFDAAVVTDERGVITDWNTAAETLYGYARVEAIGRSVGMLHAPEDADRATSELLTTIERAGRWQSQSTLRRKDGAQVHVESVVVPVVDRDGRVVGSIGIHRDITARVEAERKLERLAFYDPLTGVANRALAMDRLEHAVARAKRERLRVGVLFVDLDDFKRLNDQFGCSRADKVLQEIAGRLQRAVRAGDTVARIGGDEFVVIVEGAESAADIAQVADRVQKALAEPHVLDGWRKGVGASVGLAICPRDAASPEELLSLADDAMFKDKRSRAAGRS